MTDDAQIMAGARKVVNADPEQCWRTLTDPGLVAEYFFGTHVESDWRVGSPVSYTGEWNGERYEDRGVVLEAAPPLVLVTEFFSPGSGKPDVPENHQTVTYRITPIDGGCRVTVSQDNNESAESAEHSSANWQAILDGFAKVAPRA